MRNNFAAFMAYVIFIVTIVIALHMRTETVSIRTRQSSRELAFYCFGQSKEVLLECYFTQICQ